MGVLKTSVGNPKTDKTNTGYLRRLRHLSSVTLVNAFLLSLRLLLMCFSKITAVSAFVKMSYAREWFELLQTLHPDHMFSHQIIFDLDVFKLLVVLWIHC